MKAKKCDRCRQYYDLYTAGPETKYANMLIFAAENDDGYIETRQFELCHSCMSAAVYFMQEFLPPEKE